MIHDWDDNKTTKNSGVRLKTAIRELSNPEVNLDEFYLKYNLHESPKRYGIEVQYSRHCINWLYTVRCECGSGGKKFLNICLHALIDTMKKPLDEMQFAFTKILFDMVVLTRNLYY